VTARLGLAEGTLRLTDVAGTVAGTSVGGKLVIGVQQAPMTLDGDIELGAVDLPVAIAVALGMPAQSASTGTNATANANAFAALWPAEPFEEAWRPLSGHVAVKSARVALTPKLAARDVRGVVHFGEAQLAVQVIDADMAGGRMAGELIFLRSNEGLLARSRIKLTGVEAAELLPGDGSLAGRLTLDVSAEGAGRSPVALIGSLAGSGTFMLENARLSRLDPAAFGAVIRAADQGLAVDAVRVRDRVDAALARDSLAVTLAEGTITINAGQAQLSNVMARAQGADLAVSGSVNLAEGALDARFTLLGAGGPGAPANTRPEIMVALKGPIDAPKRSVDAAAFASWLALRAVEQQSKKLDVLEGREAAPNSPAGDAAQQPAPAPDAAAVDTTAPAAPAEPDASRLLPPVRSPPATSSVQKPKPTPPSAEQAQPPPIDIRPAPASRTPRQQSGAAAAPSGQTPPPKSATTPARPRSLSEILFGN
jgi:large subunit ribosomal protein L24